MATDTAVPTDAVAPPVAATSGASGAAAADPTRSIRSTVRGIGSVVGTTSAVTALLYYFGWTRTSVEAHQLGLDDSLLGYSTQDYLLRSLSSMFGPFVVGLLAILVLLGFHAAVISWIRRSGGFAPDGPNALLRRRLWWMAVGLGLVAAASLGGGIAGALARRPRDWVYVASPVCVTFSLVDAVYAANVWHRFLAAQRGEPAPEARGLHAVTTTLIILLLLVSVFWNVSHYAVVKGHRLARTVEELIPTQPTVVVYSSKRLYLQPPVVETRLDPHDSAYLFAYSRLKLLFRSDHKYFLRPSDTTSQANIVVPDDLDIRLEFFRGE